MRIQCSGYLLSVQGDDQASTATGALQGGDDGQRVLGFGCLRLSRSIVIIDKSILWSARSSRIRFNILMAT